MNNRYAIGDLHGCSKTFRKLVRDVIRLEKSDVLYCMGDYIDRGPDSKGVIDFILELRENGYTVNTLRGNHDQMMMDASKNSESLKDWLRNGGSTTLKSFNVQSYEELDSKYKRFFYETQFYFETGNYILVHAGLNFRYEDPFQDTNAMMWIRGFTVDKKKLGDRIIVHGHTPLPWDVIQKQQGENVIGIDAGCVYPNLTGFGHLVAFNLTTGEFFAVDNCE